MECHNCNRNVEGKGSITYAGVSGEKFTWTGFGIKAANSQIGSTGHIVGAFLLCQRIERVRKSSLQACARQR